MTRRLSDKRFFYYWWNSNATNALDNQEIKLRGTTNVSWMYRKKMPKTSEKVEPPIYDIVTLVESLLGS